MQVPSTLQFPPTLKALSITLSIIALCSITLGSLAEARQLCPDQVAVSQHPSVTNLGPVQHCGLGLTVMDVPIVLPFVPCPAVRINVPRYEICQEISESHTRCLNNGTDPVTAQACDCVTGAANGVTLHVPVCACGPPVIIGCVERLLTIGC